MRGLAKARMLSFDTADKNRRTGKDCSFDYRTSLLKAKQRCGLGLVALS